MQREAIRLKLNDVFRDVFDNDVFEISDELKAGDVDDWDSLSHIRIIVAAEKMFSVRFAQSEIEKLRNVGDFIDLISEKIRP